MLAGCFSPKPPAGAPCPDGTCPSGLVCSPATQTCEPTATAIDAPPPDSPPDAPPPVITYRRRLTITNNAGSSLPTGFTIRVPLDLGALVAAGKVQADYSDLYVIGKGSIGERDRIVDPAAGPAPAAVSFSLAAPLAAGNSTTDYSIEYGDITAGAPLAVGANVYRVYDGFTTGLASVWLTNAGPATDNGQLVLRANQTDAITTTAATDGIPIVSEVELVATITNPNSAPTTQTEGTFYYWFGYQHTGDFVASDPWAVWIARGTVEILPEQKSPVGCELGCAGPAVAQNTLVHHYAIQRDPSETRFYKDGALLHTVTVTNNADYSLMVRNYLAAGEVRVDWIRARGRVAPDPTVTLGIEEIL